MKRRFMSINGFSETFDVNNYLTIEALEEGLTISFENDIEYGIDGKGWVVLKKGVNSPKLQRGQTISFKGALKPIAGLGIGTFSISRKCNLLGNVMSLLFAQDAMEQKNLIGYDYAFYNLFNKCPIISISSSFLPATTLATYCYYYMFSGCTSLTTAPELPATTLANDCYDSMFSGCNKLNYIKMLATDISAFNCLSSWVRGVSSTGTFVKNPAMTSLPTGVNGIPSGWTVVNDGEEPGGGGGA